MLRFEQTSDLQRTSVISGTAHGHLDNIVIDWLWQSLKQDAGYLHQITDGSLAKRIIDHWIECYKFLRPHTALDKRTQDTAYFGQMEARKVA